MNEVIQYTERGAILIGGNTFIRADILEISGCYNRTIMFYGDDVDSASKASKYYYIHFSNKLLLKTSSRRYTAMGFINVQTKYNMFFFHSVFKHVTNHTESIERIHPG